MNDDICETCGGDGVTCDVHATADGCDCEDGARVVTCADCGGTGRRDETDDEQESGR